MVMHTEAGYGAIADIPLPLRGVLASAGDLQVRLAASPDDLAAAQALRYDVFYREMAAQASPEMAAIGRDFDFYDDYCDMLLVIDQSLPDEANVVGTYRLLRQEVAPAAGGFYTESEFDISALTRQFRPDWRGLELGRSCVHRDYRNQATIQLLWRGIGQYIATHRIGYMFGCASLPGTDPQALALPLSFLYHRCLAPADLRVRALPERYTAMDLIPADRLDDRAAIKVLPPLIKGYLRLGCHIGDGAVVDHQFGTTDVCIILPVERIQSRYFSHFERPGGTH
jgi:putative hemolysin